MDDKGDVPGQHEAARYHEAGHYHAHVETKCIDSFVLYLLRLMCLGAEIDRIRARMPNLDLDEYTNLYIIFPLHH
jgi:hypothetical protein